MPGYTNRILLTAAMAPRLGDDLEARLVGPFGATDWRAVPRDGLVGGPADDWGIILGRPAAGDSSFRVELRRSGTFGPARMVDGVAVAVTLGAVEGTTMPERIALNQILAIGPETTPGTAVPPVWRLTSLKGYVQPVIETEEMESMGDTLPSDYVQTSERSDFALDGKPTYDEMGLVLAGLFGAPATTVLGNGAFRHVWVYNPRGRGNPRTYTVEQGDDELSERTAYNVFSEWMMSFSGKSAATASAKAFGRTIEPRSGITAGPNAVQTITLGTATTFNLRKDGHQTAAVTAAGLTASAVQTAILALPSVGAGGATVSGTGPFIVTYGGTNAGKAQSALEVIDAVGGTAPTVAQTTTGGFGEMPAVPVVATEYSGFFAATRADLAAGKLTRLYDFAVNLSGRFAPEFTGDADVDSFGHIGESKTAFTVTVTVQEDASSRAIAQASRARLLRWFRWLAKGPVISGAQTYEFRIDLPCKVAQRGSFSESGTVFAREYVLGGLHDPSINSAAVIELVNMIPSY